MCGYGTEPDFLNVSERKARKEHRCCECGGRIPPGAVYVYTFGEWDGDTTSYKQHLECRDLLEAIADEYCGGESPVYGSLMEEIGEYEDRDEETGEVNDRLGSAWLEGSPAPLYGPGHLHGALDRIEARYAAPSA